MGKRERRSVIVALKQGPLGVKVLIVSDDTSAVAQRLSDEGLTNDQLLALSAEVKEKGARFEHWRCRAGLSRDVWYQVSVVAVEL